MKKKKKDGFRIPGSRMMFKGAGLGVWSLGPRGQGMVSGMEKLGLVTLSLERFAEYRIATWRLC